MDRHADHASYLQGEGLYDPHLPDDEMDEDDENDNENGNDDDEDEGNAIVRDGMTQVSTDFIFQGEDLYPPGEDDEQVSHAILSR